MTVAARASPPSTPKVRKTVTLDERVHRLQRARSLRPYLDQDAAAEGPSTKPGFKSSCNCSVALPVGNPVLHAEAVRVRVQADHPSRRQVHHLLEAASRLQRELWSRR